MGRAHRLPFLDERFDELDRLVDAQYGGVYREVVRLGRAPRFVRIIIVVRGTSFVCLGHQAFGLLYRDVHALHDALYADFGAVVDKEAEARRVVSQDIIRATSYHDARFLFRQVADRVALDAEQFVV